MKLLALLLAAGLTALGVYGLAEATQNRPDKAYPDQVSELTLGVSTKDGYSPVYAAHGLWAACRHTVRSVKLATPIARVAIDRFELVVKPALGTHGKRRLVGCLQDATTPGVSARVVDGPHRRAP